VGIAADVGGQGRGFSGRQGVLIKPEIHRSPPRRSKAGCRGKRSIFRSSAFAVSEVPG
jgi:hypothetical protein